MIHHDTIKWKEGCEEKKMLYYENEHISHHFIDFLVSPTFGKLLNYFWGIFWNNIVITVFASKGSRMPMLGLALNILL